MVKMKRKKINESTSWEKVGDWYHKNVGKSGMYYHQTLVLPGVLRLLQLKNNSSLLDVGCGQGVLSRQIGPKVEYCGLDISPKLVDLAKKERSFDHHSFFVGDATKPFPVEKKDFSHASIVLALQNMESPESTILNISKHLQKNGTLVIAMNHPYFRVPRMTSWQVDESKKIQYRRVDNYMSPQKIPIHAHPGKGAASEVTYSFHFPLCDYFYWLSKAGFAVDLIEEWCSDKKSTGSKARMEDRARSEFPLFLALRAIKIS